jgi:hypothetical protein
MTDKEKFVQLFKSINYPLEIGQLEDTDLSFYDNYKETSMCIAFDEQGKFITFYNPVIIK